MKKNITLIVVAVILAIGGASAQVRIGITTGLELSTMLDKDNHSTYSDDYNSKAGLKIGLVTEFGIGKYFAISPELVFAQRGFSMDLADAATTMGGYYYGDARIRTNVNCLQLPINAIGRIPINDNFNVSFFAGPYFGYALSGKIKYVDLSSAEESMFKAAGQPLETDIEFGSSKTGDDMKAFDMGLNFGAGIELYSCFFKIQYNLGLANLYPNTDNSAKLANRNVGLSVGYLFNVSK